MITIKICYTETNTFKENAAKATSMFKRLCAGSYQTGVKDTLTAILTHYDGSNINELCAAIYAEAFGVAESDAPEQLRRSVRIRQVARSCAHDAEYTGMPD